MTKDKGGHKWRGFIKTSREEGGGESKIRYHGFCCKNS